MRRLARKKGISHEISYENCGSPLPSKLDLRLNWIDGHTIEGSKRTAAHTAGAAALRLRNLRRQLQIEQIPSSLCADIRTLAYCAGKSHKTHTHTRLIAHFSLALILSVSRSCLPKALPFPHMLRTRPCSPPLLTSYERIHIESNQMHILIRLLPRFSLTPAPCPLFFPFFLNCHSTSRLAAIGCGGARRVRSPSRASRERLVRPRGHGLASSQ